MSKPEKQKKKEIEKATTDHKEKFLDDYVNMYDDEQMLKLYELDVHTAVKYLTDKINAKIKELQQDEDDETISIDRKKIRKDIVDNLKLNDYELMYPQTTKYISSNIFHGYDSMFYVLNKNSDGHVIPFEYTNANFNSTFYKYFPDYIKKWFDVNTY